MHSDEYRSPSILRRQKLAMTLSDPKGAFRRLENLEGAQRKSELRKLLSEKDQLQSELEKTRNELAQAKSQSRQFRRARDLAETRLDSLRNSRSMKLGRTLSSPLRFARAVKKNPTELPLRVSRKIKRTIVTPSRIRRGSSKSPRENSSVEEFAKLTKLPLFLANQTPENLEAALNELWYQRGEIRRPSNLIADYPELVREMSDKGQILAHRIYGSDSLGERISIPQRSRGAAFVAEPQRVMYCVHSTPVFNSNGYSTRTRGVASGLKQSGVDVVVVGRSGYPWDSKADVPKPGVERFVDDVDDVPYIHLSGGNLNRDALFSYFMESADAFVREAKIQRPSLIQSASNFRTALPALIASRRVGVPFVYEVRGLWELTEASKKPGFSETERFREMSALETLVAQESDIVLAITPQVRDKLIDRGVDAEKIIVAPNAVDPRAFLPLPQDKSFAKENDLSTDVPVVGFAGSMVDYEGLDYLVEASCNLAESGVDHRLVFAGSGAVEPQLRDLAQQREAGHIRFLGRIPQDDVPRLMSLFDIVACPRKSQLITELVSPLKPLEAFACSKATLLSDVAPHRDLAGPHQERAVLFAADDVESLESGLRKLIEGKELRGNIGRKARLWTVTDRNWAALGAVMRDAHALASVRYQSNVRDSRPLSSLNVAVIGDEFTRTTLAGSFTTVLLSRKNWREQFEQTNFDLVFVESAWEGNEGEWHRGVGYYSDEESADLRALLDYAKSCGVPSVFWNKEDPVHFARFAPNAALFDFVFTTDANMIPRYLATPGNVNQAVSSLPFYAQPAIHNPLPVDREFHDTIAYAGTYYGDRYADRSCGLDQLLQLSADFGLEIYDRQASNPGSPYKFPAKYSDSVQGSLPYEEVISSYSTHIAHLNVNSVIDSPTMFSRRVVEIPACGGVVLSAVGRGIAETVGDNLAYSDQESVIRAWLNDWTSNKAGRLDEIWRQMRTIYRSHTTDTAMAILCRTAGLGVDGLDLPSYAVELEIESAECLLSVLEQSVKPACIVSAQLSEEDVALCGLHGIEVVSELPDGIGYVSRVSAVVSRTHFEDLLLASRFGAWDNIVPASAEEWDGRSAIAVPMSVTAVPDGGMAATSPASGNAIAVTLPPVLDDDGAGEDAVGGYFSEPGAASAEHTPVRTVLVAGHDLKFAGHLLRALEDQGLEVLFDQWESHTKHDEAASRELLERADVVFCEWGLGNAVWYSHNVKPGQKLVVRVHSQELFRPFLAQIDHESVAQYIFVGELIRSAAVISHGVPREKTVIIPNPVDIESLALPKNPGAEFGIGFVGIVPQSKRLDLALDVLEQLLDVDERYHLRIKGKTPEDYPWMKNRPEEMSYYEEQNRRIEALNSRVPGAVRFDGFGADMPEWYRNVGIVLSTSDFESFHLTIADGAASGARPFALNWPGADLIYPLSWLSASVGEIVHEILESHNKLNKDQQQKINSIDKRKILPRLAQSVSEV